MWTPRLFFFVWGLVSVGAVMVCFMSVVVCGETKPGAGVVDVPRKEGGELFEWCVFDGGGRWVFADTAGEAVGVVFAGDPGYPSWSVEARAEVRVRAAARVAVFGQALVCDMARQKGLWVVLSGVERGVLLSPRTPGPRGLGDRWGCVVPLVVSSAWFEPWWPVPFPAGNVRVVDGFTDESLLETVDGVGGLRVWRVTGGDTVT